MKRLAFFFAYVLLMAVMLCAWAGAETVFEWESWQLTVCEASYDEEKNICVLLESMNAPIPLRTIHQRQESFLLCDGDGLTHVPDGIIFPAEGIKSNRQAMLVRLIFSLEARVEDCALKVVQEDGKSALISLGNLQEVSQMQEAAGAEIRASIPPVKTQEPSGAAGIFATIPPVKTQEPSGATGIFATIPPVKTQEPSGAAGVFATVPPVKTQEPSGSAGIFATVPPVKTQSPGANATGLPKK